MLDFTESKIAITFSKIFNFPLFTSEMSEMYDIAEVGVTANKTANIKVVVQLVTTGATKYNC